MKNVKLVSVITAMTLALGLMAANLTAEPEATILSGKLIDLTCAAKGAKLMGNSHNALNDTHKTPNGDMASCATMCLKGGQPAAVFANGKIQAVLLANATLNLYKFAAKDVEIKGWYAGGADDAVKTFMPAKIRVKGDKEWIEVRTAARH